jgi:ribosome biogenesis GTPase A
MATINWYPGHMAKSRRMLIEQMRAVDAVVELCDARAPYATRNPDLDALCKGKQRILILNKADLAEERLTRQWMEHFKAQGLDAVKFNANGGKAKEVLAPIQRATQAEVDRMKARGVNKTVRLMVIGIPNVGKSTFINRLYGSAVTKASDRPGVTRSKQWVKVGPYLELLDTPGMLWPKLSDQQVAQELAFLGSVRDQILDGEELAGALLLRLMEAAPEQTMARFKIRLEEGQELTPEGLMDLACRGRGWLLSGARPDTARGAALVLDEFRSGKIGRITLDRVPERI